ncbi:MAG: amidohydrolase family protein [Actinomycetota bacterium]|nr:amidohydrolase family protein [Actinomycetota bacterium]
MQDFPRIISVDDHVLEPPDLWQARLPEAYRSTGPRVERKRMRFTGGGGGWADDPAGTWCDVWRYEDVSSPLMMLQAAAGFEALTMELTNYDEVRPGSWKQLDRLADMDLDHIEAAVCFPNVLPRFCGQTFLEGQDKQLGLLSVQAYNDWMIDEWTAGAARGRLIPLTIVPLWDAHLAADEVRRCAAKGSHAVSFTECPVPLGLPSLYDKDRFWDPFFAACDETESIICMHIGSSSRMPTTAPDAPMIVGCVLDWQNAVGSLTDYMISGTMERFPGLKLAYSEGQVGWMPYTLERMDKIWAEFRGPEFGNHLSNPPSTYARGRVFGCIFDDDTGLRNRDAIGMDQICFETDYPHSQSTWPNSREQMERLCAKAGLSDAEVYKLARGNAISAFGLSRFGIS